MVTANLDALIHQKDNDESTHYGSAYATTSSSKFSVDESPCAHKKKSKNAKNAE